MTNVFLSNLGNKEHNQTIELKRPCSSELANGCCKILEDILDKNREQSVMSLIKYSLEVTDRSTPKMRDKEIRMSHVSFDEEQMDDKNRMDNLFREFNFPSGNSSFVSRDLKHRRDINLMNQNVSSNNVITRIPVSIPM